MIVVITEAVIIEKVDGCYYVKILQYNCLVLFSAINCCFIFSLMQNLVSQYAEGLTFHQTIKSVYPRRLQPPVQRDFPRQPLSLYEPIYVQFYSFLPFCVHLETVKKKEGYSALVSRESISGVVLNVRDEV